MYHKLRQVDNKRKEEQKMANKIKIAFDKFSKTVTFSDAVNALATNEFKKFEAIADQVDQTPKTIAAWKVADVADVDADWIYSGDFNGDETPESIKAEYDKAEYDN